MPAAHAVRLVTAADVTDIAGLSYLTLPTSSRAALRAAAPATRPRPSRRRARRRR
jgi:hypothetical protein